MEAVTLYFSEHLWLTVLLRLLVSTVCGGIIGVERTLRQKDAGFRTHIIVSMGSALMMIISKYGFQDVTGIGGISADASRVAANIITGISFLGAGMIFVKGVSIKGLTTAAGIWVTSAVGMAIGAGMYAAGLVAVVILLLVQIIFHKFLIGFDKVLANDNMIPCFIQLKNTPEAISGLKSFLREHKIQIFDSTVETGENNTLLTVRLNLQFGNEVDIDAVMAEYLTLPEVTQAFTL